MKNMKVFGVFALLLVSGMFVVPALAQQMQSRSQLGDGDGVCDNDCDGVPDQLRRRECNCDGSQTQDRLKKGDMTQTRDRLCTVADQTKLQQRIQLKDQSC